MRGMIYKLIQFIKPFRHQKLCAHFGLSSISNHYNRRITNTLSGISKTRRLEMAVLLSMPLGRSMLSMSWTFWSVVLSTTQPEFTNFLRGQIEIEFGGYIFSQDWYKIYPQFTAAIWVFQLPGNRIDHRPFFGFADQLSSFRDQIYRHMEPLHDLPEEEN